MPNIKNIISNTSLFRMLDEVQLNEIVSATDVVHVRPNTRVVEQGSAADGVFWVVYGQVKIACHSNQSSDKTLEILGPSKCFGLSEMLLEQPHLASVVTTMETMLLHTERDTVLQIAEKNFDLTRELMVCVGRQCYSLMRDIGSYSQTAKQRLAAYLLGQSRHQADDKIELVASKVLIASRLSLTPETLSRMLRELCSEDLITVSGSFIKILDSEKMRLLLA